MADRYQTPTALDSTDDSTQNQQGTLLPAGLRDLMPAEARHQEMTTRCLLDCFAGFGYQRVKPPLVEFEETLIGQGPGAALAADTFRMMDPVSRRMLALRADMTAQIGRIATSRLAHAARPLRLAYCGDILRVTPDPLNPERQLGQLGAELVGCTSPMHDAEVAVLALEALRRAGLEQLTIDLNAPGLVTLLLEQSGRPQSVAAMRRALSMKDQDATRQAAGPLADSFLGLLDMPFHSAVDAPASLLEIAETLPEPAAIMLRQLASIADHIRQAADFATITLDPLESRGFDYHTGFGFSIFAPSIRGELGRGGRYRTASLVASEKTDSSDGVSTTELATGVTLYMEPVLRGIARKPEPPLLYVPASVGLPGLLQQAASETDMVVVFGHPDADSAALAAADARALGASHIVLDGVIKLLD